MPWQNEYLILYFPDVETAILRVFACKDKLYRSLGLHHHPACIHRHVEIS